MKINKIVGLILSFNFLYALAIEQKPLVVIIPSYNNKDWYQKNLDSIFSQHYENYRIIYCDDASDDGTFELVEAYIAKCNQRHRVTLIRNSQRLGALANHYKAVHMCKDFEIILNLDGDDWLKQPYVFERINKEYQDPEVWMTYGQFEHYPSGKIGQCKPVPDGVVAQIAYREYGDWITSHLRTFYAGLFKRVKLEDLLCKHGFFRSACDMAFMFPLLEMSSDHAHFIPEVLYVYNQANRGNIFKSRVIEQIHNDKVIRSKEKYKPLKQLFEHKKSEYLIDALIFSENRPDLLYATLDTMHRYCSGLGDLFVVYIAQDEQSIIGYQNVSRAFGHVHMMPIDNNMPFVIKTAISQMAHDYLFCIRDGVIIKDFIYASECINSLEKTGAYAFYFALGMNITMNDAINRDQNIPLLVHIEEDIFAWRMADAEYDWHIPHQCSMALYRMADIASLLNILNCQSFTDLQLTWNNTQFDVNKIGLCFEQSKVLSIDCENCVYAFNKGLVIDTVPFFRLNNKSIFMQDPIELIK